MSDILKELDKAAKEAKKLAEKVLITTSVAKAVEFKTFLSKNKYHNQISNKKDNIKNQIDTISNQLENLSKGKWAKSAQKSLTKTENHFK